MLGYKHFVSKPRKEVLPADSFLCDGCKMGLYSTEGWQAVLDVRGYRYRTTWKASAKAGENCCRWCQFIAKEITAASKVTSSGVWEIWVAYEDSSFTPVGQKTLNVIMRLIQGGKTFRSHYYIYTNKGTSLKTCHILVNCLRK